MKIGIDIRPLQTGHKYRGIGEVTKQVTNRLLAIGADNTKDSFVFFEYEDAGDPKDLLTIPRGLTYEVVKVGPSHENDTGKKAKALRYLKDVYGRPVSARNTDVFLQFDYALGIPRGVRTVLVKHDLIPYIFWNKYFTSAWEPFRRKAARTTLKTFLKNYHFMHVLRRSLRQAHAIVAVSESTKQDVQKYFKVPSKKVKVALLGVDVKPAKTNGAEATVTMPTKQYLLFVGAGDARRRVDDLVAAFNNLKADGNDLQLVLVGENFKKPTDIPNVAVRNEVIRSSYSKDILTMGYIDDQTKHELFAHALAFVYPTKYEGFGIPVLEAMLLGCPIITYKNSSLPEVGGAHAVYAKDWQDIAHQVRVLQAEPKGKREERLKAAKEHAKSFTWDGTADAIYKELVAAARRR
jgi:glycosyltransferase involved in cell wall biosynthesis